MFARFPILHARQGQEAGSLSGGEQQILAFARGLMARPKLLLVDEPTVGLSPLMVKELSRALRAIHRRWRGDPAGGAERGDGAAAGKPRLSAGDRPLIAEGDTSTLRTNDYVRQAYLGV